LHEGALGGASAAESAHPPELGARFWDAFWLPEKQKPPTHSKFAAQAFAIHGLAQTKALLL